jgi:diguanylate cyclase (GGDEF)-like protein
MLVVDDDPHVRNEAARQFAEHQIAFEVAASAEEALALIEHEQFDTVLVDLNMPGLGGPALLRRLEVAHPNSRCVILVDAEPLNRSPVPSGNIIGILRKPWRADELLRCIKHPPLEAPAFDVSAGLPDNERLSVLLLENDPGDVLLFKTALRLAGAQAIDVHTASTMSEALAALSQDRYDVVLSDLSLPDSCGFETVSTVQHAAPDSAVVVYTSADNPVLALQIVQSGGQDYLVKGQASGSDVVKALRHATERKRIERRLVGMALSDPLTGLANRTQFRQRIAHARARRRRGGCDFAVLLLDMDNFKGINDALGHDAGDEFLRQVSSRLKDTIRECDALARLGGDEFAVLFERLESIDEAISAAERIIEALRQPLRLGSAEVVSTASAGVAYCPSAGETLDELLKAADVAMYQAKAGGRDRCEIFGQQLSDAAVRRWKLTTGLRRAVSEGLIEVHYQPQVRIDAPGLVGMEALLRWSNEFGAGPDEFIPLLEQHGMIQAVGEWMLRRSLMDLVIMRESGLDIPRVAVNVSPVHFQGTRLIDTVSRCLEETGLCGSDLELELTEPMLMRNTRETLDILARLKEVGVSIAIDDFGTGYSSLSTLHQLPVDVLKIDRSLMPTTASDSRGQIVGAILDLARRLGMSVVAEGVETQAQCDFLRREGCPIGQGYHWSAAKSVAEVVQERFGLNLTTTAPHDSGVRSTLSAVKRAGDLQVPPRAG